MAEDQKQDNQSVRPGLVITPSGAAPSAASTPVPAPPPVPEPAEPQAPRFKPELPEADSSVEGAVTWTASEFIAHDKSGGWYLGLTIVTIAFSALIFLLTRDIISVAVIIIAALLFGVYGARQPRQLQYGIDQVGITVAGKRYLYDEFKSFSVIPEGGFSSINFMPLRRFSPITTIYYAPADEKKIMDVLTTCLPYEEPRRDLIDGLMRRIRF